MSKDNIWTPEEEDMTEINSHLLKTLKRQRLISVLEFDYFTAHGKEIVDMMNRVNQVYECMPYEKVFLLVLSVFHRDYLGE